MAAQRSLEPLILVRIRAPLPFTVMNSALDEDPHLGKTLNPALNNKHRAPLVVARCLLFTDYLRAHAGGLRIYWSMVCA